MATVFQKVSGNALVLEPRETLVYPFNLGDYSEIRMGGFFSVVGTGQANNNLVGADETINSQTATVSQFAFGLTYVTGTNHIPLLPRTSESFFIGTLRNTGAATSVQYSNSRIVEGTTLPITFVTGISNLNTVNTSAFQIPSQPSGDTSYARSNTYKFTIANNIYSFSKPDTENSEATNVSVPKLRDILLNNTYSTSARITGFYTNDGTSSGTALNKPNAIYIYSPFLNNRLRVHTLLVERYS